MRKLLYILLPILIFSCKTVENNSSSVADDFLFAVEDDSVSIKEFKYVYNKNNTTNGSAYTKQDVEEYFELYKTFKLKIAEAKSQGIDSTTSYKKEFNSYKEELKRPYLTETKITKKLVDEAYDRFNTEIRASHILLRLEQDASPEDTLAVYKRIVEIKQKADEYQSFAELAREYSEDPSAKQNGGNLGYFTSFQMVYPFESAAYNTNAGEISEPVRTRFGYHIIKVHDKRGANGTLSVSHIMLRKSNSQKDSVQLRDKIFEIYEQAKGGANWDQLVEQYSEDVNSKKKGGNLQPFKLGQMPFDFQEAAFGLNKKGEISDPVKTAYGWHIIKLEDRKPIAEQEEMEPLIKSRIKKDSRAQISQNALVDRLKSENNFLKNEESFNKITSFLDRAEDENKWSTAPLYNDSAAVLFTISNQKYSIGNLIRFIENNKMKGLNRSYFNSLLEDFKNKKILTYEENHLEEKYYDYKMLVKEYKEGIMLFKIMEDEVWTKAVQDTTGLKEFYNKNVDQYKWKNRVDAMIYYSQDTSVLNEIKSLIHNGNIEEYSKKELEDKYNAQTALTLQIDSGKFEYDYNEVVRRVEKSQGVYLIQEGSRFALVHVKAVLGEMVKPLNKIKGIVISDYQNELERNWVDKLKEKYRITVNDKALKYVYDSLVKQ